MRLGRFLSLLQCRHRELVFESRKQGSQDGVRCRRCGVFWRRRRTHRGPGRGSVLRREIL
jgi:hypothetical protein